MGADQFAQRSDLITGLPDGDGDRDLRRARGSCAWDRFPFNLATVYFRRGRFQNKGVELQAEKVHNHPIGAHGLYKDGVFPPRTAVDNKCL